MALSAINEMRSGRHLHPQQVTVAWRRLMPWWPIGIPDAALTRRRKMTRRDMRVSRERISYDNRATASQEKCKAKGD